MYLILTTTSPPWRHIRQTWICSQFTYVVISLILSPFPSVSPMGTKVLHTVQSSDRHYILVCIVALFGPQNTFRCLQNYIFYYLHLSFSLVLYSLHLMAGIRYNILIWYRPICDVVGDIHSAASFDRNDRYNYGYIIIRQWNRCPINIPRLCETHFICQLPTATQQESQWAEFWKGAFSHRHFVPIPKPHSATER